MKLILHFILKQFHFIVFFNTLFIIYSNLQDFNSKIMEIDDRDKDISLKMGQIRAKISKAKEIEENLSISKKRLEDVVRQIQSVEKKLPENLSDTEILEYFSQIANKINLSNVQQSPLKEEEREFYIAKQYQFNATGTFLQLIIFFEQLEKAETIYNLISLKMEKTKEKFKGRFQVLDIKAQIEALYYNANVRPETSIDVKKMAREKSLEIKKNKKMINLQNIQTKIKVGEDAL